MANIKTEFYASIARLQKQLESNSLSKDDKADAVKYIKDTLNNFREKLSPSEKKISVDDVKELEQTTTKTNTKTNEVTQKINALVTKEEIQEVINTLQGLKTEFDTLNTQVSNAINERPSKADYEGLQQDLSNTQSTYLDTALKDLNAKLNKDIEDAKAAKQDKIPDNVRNEFVGNVEAKRDTCIEKLGKVRSKGKDLSDKAQKISNQIAPIQVLYNKFSDIQDKISVMFAKASNGKISKEDNAGLSEANNQFTGLVQDVTNLLITTQEAAQQSTNLEEINNFISSIVTDEVIKEKFNALTTKIDEVDLHVEAVEEAPAADKIVKAAVTTSSEASENVSHGEDTSLVPNKLETFKQEFEDLKMHVSGAITAKPSQSNYNKLKEDFTSSCDTTLKDLNSKLKDKIKTAKDKKQDKIPDNVRNEFVGNVETKRDACIQKLKEIRLECKSLLKKAKEASGQVAPIQSFHKKLSEAIAKTYDETERNQLNTLIDDVTNLLNHAKQDPNIDAVNQFMNLIQTDEFVEKEFNDLTARIDTVDLHAQIEDNTQYNDPFVEFIH